MVRFLPSFGGTPKPQHSGNPAQSISGQLAFWLGRTSCGEARKLGALDVVPIVHAGPHGEAPMLLHDALACGALKMGEKGLAGSVNEVIAHNMGKQAVLILEGESIVGAKQNRVVTLDVLVAPQSKVGIPVGCVEQGRWHHTSQEFSSADMPLEPSMRARNVREMGVDGELNQGRLWGEVAAKLERTQVSSRSGDYHEVTSRKRGELEAQLKDMPRVENQVGMIAFLDSQLLAMDVLGAPANWESMAERLTKAYLMAGLDVPAMAGAGVGGSLPAKQEPVEVWLNRIAGAHVRVRPGVGLGVQVSLAARGLNGGGLWTDGGLVHLAVFGAE